MKKLLLAGLLAGLFVALVATTVFAGSYGAIAYSPSIGCHGYAYGYYSAQEAIAAAVGGCGRSDCESRASFSDACGALAKATNGAIGTGISTTSLYDAVARALFYCRYYGGEDCVIICEICSGR